MYSHNAHEGLQIINIGDYKYYTFGKVDGIKDHFF